MLVGHMMLLRWLYDSLGSSICLSANIPIFMMHVEKHNQVVQACQRTNRSQS